MNVGLVGFPGSGRSTVFDFPDAFGPTKNERPRSVSEVSWRKLRHAVRTRREMFQRR